MQTRFRLLLIFISSLLIIGYLSTRIISFAHIFFTHAGIAITQAEIKDEFTRYAVTGGVDPRPQYIPRKIHQVYHDWSKKGGNGGKPGSNGGNAVGGEGGNGDWGNGPTGGVDGDKGVMVAENVTIPSDWDEVRATCRALNPDWEYTLWTDQKSREFIETLYPWFLSTYDGYRYPVQRADTVRYFILRHYGGVYLDLDNGCLQNLTPLLYYPTWTTDGARGALSNNILASAPGHPFWVLLTESLIPYNWNYFFPYVTISYASGQWFETAIWEKYHDLIRKPRRRGSKGDNGEEEELKPLHRIMMDDRPGTDPWIYFTQQRGGTWVNWDNAFFLWIGDHLILLGLGGVTLAVGLWWGGRACLALVRRRGKGYKAVAHDV